MLLQATGTDPQLVIYPKFTLVDELCVLDVLCFWVNTEDKTMTHLSFTRLRENNDDDDTGAGGGDK